MATTNNSVYGKNVLQRKSRLKF